MASAQLAILVYPVNGNLGGTDRWCERGFYLVCAVAHDDYDRFWRERKRSVEYMTQHGRTANRVQYLWKLGVHPGALACS